jgi:hypothetical protein
MKEQFGLLKREPARIVGAILALVAAATTFGLLGADKGALVKAVGLALITYLGAGEGIRSAVVSPATLAERVAEASLETAQRVDSVTSGPPGTVTKTAETIAVDVVAKKAGAEPSLAEKIVAKAKARAGL